MLKAGVLGVIFLLATLMAPRQPSDAIRLPQCDGLRAVQQRRRGQRPRLSPSTTSTATGRAAPECAISELLVARPRRSALHVPRRLVGGIKAVLRQSDGPTARKSDTRWDGQTTGAVYMCVALGADATYLTSFFWALNQPPGNQPSTQASWPSKQWQPYNCGRSGWGWCRRTSRRVRVGLVGTGVDGRWDAGSAPTAQRRTPHPTDP